MFPAERWENTTTIQKCMMSILRIGFLKISLKQMNFEAEKKADEIMANVTDDMSDYDKLKYFHDYLILNCQSDMRTNTLILYTDINKRKGSMRGLCKDLFLFVQQGWN
jgi:hypothetical protein